MWKLFFFYIFAIVFAFLSEKHSTVRLDLNGRKHYVRRDRIFFWTMAIVLAVFVGLRTKGNDTWAYRWMYRHFTDGGMEGLSQINWLQLSEAPGLKLIMVLLKTIGASDQTFLMVFALFTVLTAFWFLRKYTCDLPLTAFLYLMIGGYVFSMAAIKQSVAVSILLLATDAAIQKKYFKFGSFLVIAMFFHPYAPVYAAVPFLFFPPWTKKTWGLVFGTVAVAILLPFIFGLLDSATELMGYSYGQNEFSGSGVNIFRVLVALVPFGLSFIHAKQLHNCQDRSSNLVINLSIVNGLIMFIGLFGTANYFARLANYFVIFQTLSIPLLLTVMPKETGKTLKILAVLGYFMFNYYDNAIANGSFDHHYRFMSFFEYLRELF